MIPLAGMVDWLVESNLDSDLVRSARLGPGQGMGAAVEGQGGSWLEQIVGVLSW